MHIDAKQSSSETHRILTYALFASLLAHVFGLLYFQNKTTPVNLIPVSPYPSSLNVTLNTVQILQTVKVSSGSAEESVPDLAEPISSAGSTKLQAVDPKRHTQNDSKISTLKAPTTTLEMRRFLQDLPEPSSDQTTVNGAVVMNQTLLDALQKNPGIKNFTTAAGELSSSATYDAGSWTEWIQFGDKCFHVRKANPLEPYSNETWYRTACN